MLDQNLGDSEFENVRQIFSELCSTEYQLASGFRELKRIFSSRGHESLLLTLLLLASNRTFSQLDTIAHVLKMGRESGRYEEVVASLANFVANAPCDAIRWPADMAVHQWMQLLGESDPTQFFNLKYRGMPEPVDMASLLRGADIVATRIDLPQPFLDYLYRQSREHNTTQSDWEHSVRVAFAMNNITKDFMISPEILPGFVEQKASQNEFAKLDPAKGLLLLTYHGGFIRLTRSLFINEFPDGFILSKKATASKESNETTNSNNYRHSLFRAFRTLQDGKAVLIAPDGPHGTSSTTATVCSKPVLIGNGASFLAYETMCSTAWFTMVRGKDCFVPIVELGPSRETGESYNSFETRLNEFYGSKITEILCGPPINIAVGKRWTSLLNNNSDLTC